MAKKEPKVKKPKFPDEFFIFYDEDEFWSINETPYEAVTEKGMQRVGIYRLIGFVDVENSTRVSPRIPLKARAQ